MENLPKCEANYTALTPLTFLKRAAMFYANRTSIICGEARFTWSQTYHRCCSLASVLCSQFRLLKNDVVSVLAPNIPAVYEMHFAVPMAGAVLNTINIRLSAKDVKTILAHSEAKLLFVDYDYVSLACNALRLLKADDPSRTLPRVVIIAEMGCLHSNGGVKPGELKYEHLVLTTNYRNLVPESALPLVDVDPPTGKVYPRHMEYEEMVAMGDPNFEPVMIQDEWDPITLNYTSGTTAAPKGVVYSHRGAYLSTLSLILGWNMGTEPVYLWTLPMFHCNGWTFTWGVAARGGTNVCIRNTSAEEIYKNIALHKVTHLCAAPVVFDILRQAKQNKNHPPLPHPVQILTGGAPPPAALLEEVERLGFHVVHAYGLTEATGPALVCEWQKMWDPLPRERRAQLKARQGVSVLTVADADVQDMKTLRSVPRDGKAIGEIVLRGSGIMKGYLKDEKNTTEAFKNGWFHTGDIGVIHPDGYIEIKDRLKDVIISGGENISSVEVEGAILWHPKVAEAVVVAMPHERWGETPCAFVVLKEGVGRVSEQEIIQHCRSNLTHYMVPTKVVFVVEIPKTGTNKPEKKLLREIANKFHTSTSKTNQPPTTHQVLALSRL